METKDNKKIQFNIKGIELLEYSIISPDKEISKDIEYKFDISIEHKTSIEHKKIFVITTVNINNEEIDSKLGNLKVGCIYEITDLEKFISENNQIDLPIDFIITLNSITLSTVRGVMFTLFRGTFLHNVIFPIIDPKVFTGSNSK